MGNQVLSAIAYGLGEDADFFAIRYTSPLARGQLVCDFKKFSEQARKYPPIQVGDYIHGKNRRTFAQYKES